MAERSILITGCSSGIGHNAAHTLKARGWNVFASCRAEADCERLRAEGFRSPRLDYHDDQSVKAALDEVLAETGGTLDALFNNTAYLEFIRNSVVVGVAVVIITLILSLPAAYALARLTGRWGERAGILMFLVYLVPPTLLFIPMFRIVVLLGLKDSPLSLIVVYPSFTVPFSVWLLQGFFKAVPPELEEAALVDGYNRVEAFLRVVLPLSLPGIISTVVFTFTLTLHEFIYGLVFIADTSQRTLSVGVPTELILGDVYFWQIDLQEKNLLKYSLGYKQLKLTSTPTH